MDRSENRDGDPNPADKLTDELIVEILSRLPFKSLCRFKCVSAHWLHGIITSPTHRAKLPQTLTGFFRSIDTCVPSDDDEHDDGDGEHDSDDNVYGWVSRPSLHGLIPHPALCGDYCNDDDEDGPDHDADSNVDDSNDYVTSVPDFVSIVRKEEHQVVSPSLSFLPPDIYTSISPMHSSNGLVACICWKGFQRTEADYVVCNPATEEWVVLPHCDSSNYYKLLHLAVDPAPASDHFHLFVHVENHHDNEYIVGVDIYSSEARAWNHHETDWPYGTRTHQHTVFLNGMLHLATQDRVIVTVDTQGSSSKTIDLLEAMDPIYTPTNVPFIGESRGRLHYVNSRSKDQYALAVWTLEDDEKWIYKYNISTPPFFAASLMDNNQYSLVAIHPERNIVFYISRFQNTFMSYDFDLGVFAVVSTLSSFIDGWPENPYVPYVPSSRSIASLGDN